MEKNIIKDISYVKMKKFNDDNSNMPDGAFYALAEEMYNWDVSDWAWFSEAQEFDKDYS